MYLVPIEKNCLSFDFSGKSYSFSAGFSFSNSGALFSNVKKLVVVCHDSSNKAYSWVGKIFDLNGTVVQVIPFPDFSNRTAGLEYMFWGVAETDKGFRITFASNSGKDEWHEFDITEKKYIKSHEAR